MKKEHISDALNMLNDDIIEETNNAVSYTHLRRVAKAHRRLFRVCEHPAGAGQTNAGAVQGGRRCV